MGPREVKWLTQTQHTQRTQLLSARLLPELNFPYSCPSSFFHIPCCSSQQWRTEVPWFKRFPIPLAFRVPFSHQRIQSFQCMPLLLGCLVDWSYYNFFIPLSLTSGTYLNIFSPISMRKCSGKRTNPDIRHCQHWTGKHVFQESRSHSVL